MGKVNATLPRDADVNTLTLEEAVAIVDKKAGSAPAKGKKAKASKPEKAEKPAKAPAKTKAAAKPATKAKKSKAK